MRMQTGEATPMHHAPSLRAQRSNPDWYRGKTLDCFAALAMTSLRHVRSQPKHTPDMRKRPWGAGAFCSRLGVGVVYISTWRLWGAGKEPREFLKLKSP